MANLMVQSEPSCTFLECSNGKSHSHWKHHKAEWSDAGAQKRSCNLTFLVMALVKLVRCSKNNFHVGEFLHIHALTVN